MYEITVNSFEDTGIYLNVPFYAIQNAGTLKYPLLVVLRFVWSYKYLT
jgi:hypothetical protein